MPTPRMNLIAAMVDSTQGIGLNNSMAWNLPQEYAYFCKMTSKTKDPNRKNAVIMGRRCWDSLPEKFRPLSNRINVILSRKLVEPPDYGVYLASSMEEAINLLTTTPLMDQVETIWNIGGHDIYELGLHSPICHRLYLTRIYHDFETDVSFPQVRWTDFNSVDVAEEYEGEREENGVRYRFFIYEKTAFS